MATKNDLRVHRGVTALVLYSLIFGGMGIFARYLGNSFTALQQVYLRIGLAGVASFILFFRSFEFSKLRKASRREYLIILVRAALMYGLAVPLISQAFVEAKYGNVSFLGSLPFAAVFGVVLFKERLTHKKVLYLLVSVLGVACIAIQNPHELLSWGRGDVYALLSSIVFSLAYVMRKYHSKVFSNQELTTMMFVFGAWIPFVASLVLGQGLPTQWHVLPMLALVGSALANVALLLLINYGFERVSGMLASNILMLHVLFGVVIGYVFYGESLGVREWSGGMLIVLSVLLMNKHDTKHQT